MQRLPEQLRFIASLGPAELGLGRRGGAEHLLKEKLGLVLLPLPQAGPPQHV